MHWAAWDSAIELGSQKWGGGFTSWGTLSTSPGVSANKTLPWEIRVSHIVFLL